MVTVRIVAIVAVLAALAPASAQPPSADALQSARLELESAQRAFFELVLAPPQPSPALLTLRREVATLAADVVRQYALRDDYARGRIPLEGAAAEQRRSRIVGIISTAIPPLEAEFRRAARDLSALERAELVQPGEDAARRLAAASDSLDRLLEAHARAQGPLTVSRVEVRGVAGTWSWDASTPEADLVAVLELVLAGTGREIALLRAQNLELAEAMHVATLSWVGAQTILRGRMEDRALADAVAKALQGGVEAAVTLATGGAYVPLRLAITVGAELGAQIGMDYLVGNETAAALRALGEDRLGVDARDRLVERLRSGSAVDPREASVAPLPPIGSGWVRDLSVEGLKVALGAFVSREERITALAAGDLALMAWLGVSGDADAIAAARRLQAHRAALGARTAELRSLGVSIGTLLGTRAATALADWFATRVEESDEALVRRMVLEEVRLLLLGELYRESRALYDTLTLREPLLREELRAARQRRAAAGERVFAWDGDPTDRTAALRIEAPRDGLHVSVEVEYARVPWRVTVVRGAGAEVLATADGRPGARSVATVVVPPDRLPTLVGSGPPQVLAIQVTSLLAGEQDVDGDPSTPAALDGASLAWRGWEAGPDLYRVSIAEVPSCDGATLQADRPVTCACEVERLEGQVWGTDLYTDDSRRCTAAAHAGLLQEVERGGAVRYVGMLEIRVAGGCPSYRGSSARGVTTSSYGHWYRSFYFPAVQQGLCVEDDPPPPDVWYCPATLDRVPTGTASLDCYCAERETTHGIVWGTGVYTSDSSICRAALHAGFVGRFGGSVRVYEQPGQPAYDGSERNGVSTSGFPSWPRSFSFVPERPPPR